MLTTVLWARLVVRLIPLSTAFTMDLKHLPDLFCTHMTMVVQGIKPFIEDLLALGTEIPLATIWSFAMFMRIVMTAEPTFHRSCLEVDVFPLYLTHLNLTHYPRQFLVFLKEAIVLLMQLGLACNASYEHLSVDWAEDVTAHQ